MCYATIQIWGRRNGRQGPSTGDIRSAGDKWIRNENCDRDAQCEDHEDRTSDLCPILPDVVSLHLACAFQK